MSPLLKGKNTSRANITELMKGVQSPARKKAITTLAKKHNITRHEAMLRQAKAIVSSQANKK